MISSSYEHLRWRAMEKTGVSSTSLVAQIARTSGDRDDDRRTYSKRDVFNARRSFPRLRHVGSEPRRTR